MEPGAGFALHEVWRLTAQDKEDWAKLRKRLTEIHRRLGMLAFEVRRLQLEPQVFSARFWSNFYRAMLTQTVRSAMTKIVIVRLASLCFVHGYAAAQNGTNIVVALDLPKSEAIRDPDGQTEFQKNVGAVGRLLAQIQPDSYITRHRRYGSQFRSTVYRALSSYTSGWWIFRPATGCGAEHIATGLEIEKQESATMLSAD